MAINCSGCSAPCCKMLQLVSEMKEYDDGTGRCKYLTVNNKCSIYDKRPELCRTEFHPSSAEDCETVLKAYTELT